jgi:hypothetical protein
MSGKVVIGIAISLVVVSILTLGWIATMLFAISIGLLLKMKCHRDARMTRMASRIKDRPGYTPIGRVEQKCLQAGVATGILGLIWIFFC